jgi:hypothetical protein
MLIVAPIKRQGSLFVHLRREVGYRKFGAQSLAAVVAFAVTGPEQPLFPLLVSTFPLAVLLVSPASVDLVKAALS